MMEEKRITLLGSRELYEEAVRGRNEMRKIKLPKEDMWLREKLDDMFPGD